VVPNVTPKQQHSCWQEPGIFEQVLHNTVGVVPQAVGEQEGLFSTSTQLLKSGDQLRVVFNIFPCRITAYEQTRLVPEPRASIF
jgi:hypothetical protein